jgi:hypothetical protein
MDTFSQALSNAWAHWYLIKDTTLAFGFGDWCKLEGGFEYQHDSANMSRAKITKVHDEAKLAWFLLRWS